MNIIFIRMNTMQKKGESNHERLDSPFLFQPKYETLYWGQYSTPALRNE